MKLLSTLMVGVRRFASLFLMIAALPCWGAGPETVRVALSGRGPSDAVEWDFQVTSGRRAGERAKIPVPSQWEQHGFGDYDYGTVPMDQKHKEDGIYQREFAVPEEWEGQRVFLVFEGVMTDTCVKVNGVQAGPIHQGGFYQFEYDVTDKVQRGRGNQLEVQVSKDSANRTLEQAERSADYWVFGGIYRPVWLEARPQQAIAWTAVDAGADGALRAQVHLDGKGDADRVLATVRSTDGRLMGVPLEAEVVAGGPVELKGSFEGVRPWSAEEPVLYEVEFQLMRGEVVMHRTRQKIGFRTFEARHGQGVFLNGKRIMIKGVNRHCFRPDSGRALDPEDSVADVKLIKDANMNAVRCSHYPADKAFLEACDELGLYVEEEICTWQKPALDTESARRLIGQMIRRDVNHPSILWWANGNEGGWNTEVDDDFAKWDFQGRAVLHPWALFSGYQTRHYPTWEQFQADLAEGHLVMPTEYLHGLYDGGHGAGLEDFWDEFRSHANGVGGFLWVLADEGIRRTDRNGEIDLWGTNAPDGLVGPYHEKEASFLTLKDVFSPIQITVRKLAKEFHGTLPVVNQYDFRNLSSCRFRWRWVGAAGHAVGSGEFAGPSIEAGKKGELVIPLPEGWRKAAVLELEAFDPEGREIWTWAWKVDSEPTPEVKAGGAVVLREDGGILQVKAKGCVFQFDARSGRLVTAATDEGGVVGLANGPRLVGGQAGEPVVKVAGGGGAGDCWIEVTHDGAFRRFTWTISGDGGLKLDYAYQIDGPVTSHGVTFDLEEEAIRRFEWTGQGPERVWANRMRGTRFGTYQQDFHKLRPGRDFSYPHRAGFFGGVTKAEVRLASGVVVVDKLAADVFLRLGTEDEGEKIQVAWPEGQFSIMHAIPAIGNKFTGPEQVSPQGRARAAGCEVSGSVRFRLRP